MRNDQGSTTDARLVANTANVADILAATLLDKIGWGAVFAGAFLAIAVQRMSRPVFVTSIGAYVHDTPNRMTFLADFSMAAVGVAAPGLSPAGAKQLQAAETPVDSVG